MINLLLKHRYGENGLLLYLDLFFALSIGIVASYNAIYPTTRVVYTIQQSETFSIILWIEGLIVATLNIKNIAFGIGQDFFDGTIISFIQMRGRERLFLAYYIIDILLLALMYVLASEIIFILSSFSPPYYWIIEFLAPYLFISNLSLLFTIIIRRPFLSFILSVIVVFVFLALILINFYLDFFYFIIPILPLAVIDYILFKKVSI